MRCRLAHVNSSGRGDWFGTVERERERAPAAPGGLRDRPAAARGGRLAHRSRPPWAALGSCPGGRHAGARPGMQTASCRAPSTRGRSSPGASGAHARGTRTRRRLPLAPAARPARQVSPARPPADGRERLVRGEWCSGQRASRAAPLFPPAPVRWILSLTMMNHIRWGMIGCGDVAEVKSGPALQKAAGSSLVAVMRRDGAKAADYAQRHGVPRYYDDAAVLVADPEVDAVYVATPPSSHLEMAVLAAEAGKPCLVEKPMALSHAECLRMIEAFEARGVPLFVAYYRRALPRFVEARHLLRTGAIGTPTSVHIFQYRPAAAGRSGTCLARRSRRCGRRPLSGSRVARLRPARLPARPDRSSRWHGS